MRRAQNRARSARSRKIGARSAMIKSRALGALKLASEARDENLQIFSYAFGGKIQGAALHCLQWQVYDVFLTFFAEKQNYCIYSYTLYSKFRHRIIIAIDNYNITPYSVGNFEVCRLYQLVECKQVQSIILHVKLTKALTQK